MKEEKEVSKFIVEVTREDIESNEEYNKNWKKEYDKNKKKFFLVQSKLILKFLELLKIIMKNF